ncbi:MAG: hypothetical protein JXR88_17580 [Clostridia bacterium]|nr:hypothetical protein [Clostridia bacterium]
MKVIKFAVAIMLAVIFSFITRHYMSTLNLSVVSEFTPIPHFIGDVDLSYKLSLLLIFAVLLLDFSYLVLNKYFNFVISSLGIVISLRHYKTVLESYLPVDMAFLPALLEMAKIMSLFMIVGIIVQLIVDGAFSAIKLVNNNKK